MKRIWANIKAMELGMVGLILLCVIISPVLLLVGILRAVSYMIGAFLIILISPIIVIASILEGDGETYLKRLKNNFRRYFFSIVGSVFRLIPLL